MSEKSLKNLHNFLKKSKYKKYRYNLTKVKKRLFQKPPSKKFLKKLFVFLINFIYIFCVIFLNKNSQRKRWGEYGQRKYHYFTTRCMQGF